MADTRLDYSHGRQYPSLADRQKLISMRRQLTDNIRTQSRIVEETGVGLNRRLKLIQQAIELKNLAPKEKEPKAPPTQVRGVKLNPMTGSTSLSTLNVPNTQTMSFRQRQIGIGNQQTILLKNKLNAMKEQMDMSRNDLESRTVLAKQRIMEKLKADLKTIKLKERNAIGIQKGLATALTQRAERATMKIEDERRQLIEVFDRDEKARNTTLEEALEKSNLENLSESLQVSQILEKVGQKMKNIKQETGADVVKLYEVEDMEFLEGDELLTTPPTSNVGDTHADREVLGELLQQDIEDQETEAMAEQDERRQEEIEMDASEKLEQLRKDKQRREDDKRQVKARLTQQTDIETLIDDSKTLREKLTQDELSEINKFKNRLAKFQEEDREEREQEAMTAQDVAAEDFVETNTQSQSKIPKSTVDLAEGEKKIQDVVEKAVTKAEAKAFAGKKGERRIVEKPAIAEAKVLADDEDPDEKARDSDDDEGFSPETKEQLKKSRAKMKKMNEEKGLDPVMKQQLTDIKNKRIASIKDEKDYRENLIKHIKQIKFGKQYRDLVYYEDGSGVNFVKQTIGSNENQSQFRFTNINMKEVEKLLQLHREATDATGASKKRLWSQLIKEAEPDTRDKYRTLVQYLHIVKQGSVGRNPQAVNELSKLRDDIEFNKQHRGKKVEYGRVMIPEFTSPSITREQLGKAKKPKEVKKKVKESSVGMGVELTIEKPNENKKKLPTELKKKAKLAKKRKSIPKPKEVKLKGKIQLTGPKEKEHSSFSLATNEELRKKFAVLSGSLRAGNTSPELKGQLVDNVDELLKRKLISKPQHKSLMNTLNL